MKQTLALVLIALLLITLVAFPSLAEVAEVATEPPAPTPSVTVDLTQIVVSVVGLLFSFLLTWLIRAVVPPIRKWLETRTSSEQRQMFITLTRQLVHAAEQTIGAGNGKKKLIYVCDQLRKRGYTIDLDVIESTVKEMNDMLLAPIFEVGKGESVEPEKADMPPAE